MPDAVQFGLEGLKQLLESVTTNPAGGPCTCMLMELGHVFDPSATFVASVAGDEVTATGYARQTLSFQAIVEQTDGRVTREADPTDFGLVGNGVNSTVVGCYLFADSGNDATARILSVIPFGAAQLTDGTNLTIQWHPEQWAIGPNVGVGIV